MEIEGEDSGQGNFDHEGRNRRERNNKSRRKYFYVIILIALAVLVIIGIILAVTLSKKSSHSEIAKPVIQFLTISWFNAATSTTSTFRIKRDASDVDDPRGHIKNSLNSSEWRQRIDQTNNLQVRFLPYTGQAGNATNYYASSTEAMAALTNISPVKFSGSPSQENLADNYISYLKKQQNPDEQILMLFAPPITAYPNGYENDAKLTGSKLSTVISTMNKIVVIAESWNQTDMNVYNLTGNNVAQIYGPGDIDSKIIGSIGTNTTTTTSTSTTTTTPTTTTTAQTTPTTSLSSSTTTSTATTTTTTTNTTTTTTPPPPSTTPTPPPPPTTTTAPPPPPTNSSTSTTTTTTEVPVTVPTTTTQTTSTSTATTSSTSSTSIPTIPTTTTLSSTTTSPTTTLSTSSASTSSVSTTPTPTPTTTVTSTTTSSSTPTATSSSTPTSTTSSTSTSTITPSTSTTSTTASSTPSSTSTVTSTSSSTTSQSTLSSTTSPTVVPTTSLVPAHVCRSHIPFSYDISTQLTSNQFNSLKTFILSPFLSTVFSIDVKPAPYSTYADANYAFRSADNVSNVIQAVTNQQQGTNFMSNIISPLEYFVAQNVANLGAVDGLPVNVIIFAGGEFRDSMVDQANASRNALTTGGAKVIVVLVNPSVDTTNYRNVFGNNLVVWSDPEVTVSNLESLMNCQTGSTISVPTSTTVTSTFVPTSTSTISSSTTVTTTSQPTSTESSASPSSSTSSSSPTSTSSSGTPSTSTVTPTQSPSSTTSPPVTVSVCKSYIPFSFDVATDLTATEYADLKNFLINPFLEQLFPVDVQPAVFSSYSNVNNEYGQPNNVSNIIQTIQTVNQNTVTTSNFIKPLEYFVDSNIADLGSTNGLAVNTIIFAGSPLNDVASANFSAPFLTEDGNTLTVVLVNPNIDQTNYRQVTGLNIVVWSDPETTITAIRSHMRCPTVTSSTGPTTPVSSTSTTSLPASSTSTISSTTITGSSSTSTSPSTSAGTTESITSSSPTTSSATSSTSTSTETTTISSSTSTTGSSTSPSPTTISMTPTSTETTTTTTSISSSTTTPPIPVCKSYIPFSFDVATDLTATQFAELKTFLVSPFLEQLFPMDVQPAWFSTYDNINHDYTRPSNISDIVNGVQSAVQSTATSSDFNKPLQYFVDQGVADLGSTNGLAINTIIFAGSPLTDVDSATFLASTLTSNGNTLTVVLVNPNIDQTNYRNVTGLKIVVWSDFATMISAIRADMSCEPLPSTSTVTTTTGQPTSTSSPSTITTSSITPSTSETTITSSISSTPSQSPTSSATTTMSSTVVSSTTSETTLSTSEITSTTSVSTTTSPVQVCRSYIPFSFDISQKLNSTQFANLKTFLVNPFLESLFPTDVQPTWYSSYTTTNSPPRRRPLNVGEIVSYVNASSQSTIATNSDFSKPLDFFFIDKNVTNMGNVDGLYVNTVIFAGDSLTDNELTHVQTAASTLTANGNTLTVVLMDSAIDQTNYRNVTGLKIVVWSDPETTIHAIRAEMNCATGSSSTSTVTTSSPSPSTSTVESTTTSGSTSTFSTSETVSVSSSSSSTSTVTSSTTSISSTIESTSSSPTSTESTTLSSTTISSSTTTPPIQVCKSFIPFSFDVATDLTAAQFADLKTFLVNPFLSELFPVDVQPAWYSTYDNANHNYTRPNNVSDIVNNVRNSIQSVISTSDFIQPLQYFVDQNVADLGSTNGLPVNAIIFAGSPLNDSDTAGFLSPAFTTGGNTLTVVLVNPNIDQTNYRQVLGLNIVVWSDFATMIAAIRAVMNCEPVPPISTITTTTGSTTTSISSTSPSTVSSTVTESSSPSPSTVSTPSTESTTSSSTVSSTTSTIPSSSSTSTETSTSTPETTSLSSSTISSSTSTITSTVVTSPSTSESTTVSTMRTTTTPPIPVCKSYIPFSFDVATDLTATEFAELKTFLVSPFLEQLFPMDVQPAWFSTYDNANHGYPRPSNVSDVINNVQNSAQSAVATSDFIQPLQYFLYQSVADLGSADGLSVNSIIFAGSPLNDVDTATFLVPALTSNGNTLTVVLVNPNIDQTNYRQVSGLNIVVWNNTAALIDTIRTVMNCQPLPPTSTITTTTVATSTSTSTQTLSTSESSTVVTSPSSSTIPSTTTSLSSPTTWSISSTSTSSTTTPFTSETTTVNTQSTTSIIPAPTCHSYIPFSFDVSTALTPTQFADLKTFLVNPFLESVFPKNIQPLWYSSYDQINYPPTARPSNVSDIITAIPTIEQTAVGSSSFTAPLLYFLQQNVVNFGSDDGLFVNTVIFVGSALSDNDLSDAQQDVGILSQNGNTVTVVLVNPNIDQTNFQNVPGLKIVIWSDPATTIGEIVSGMNCPNIGSSSSPATTTTSTSIPSSVSTSTVTPTPTTTSTSSESTISSSSTTVSSTSPTESTTTTPLPPYICRSYIPFSFDVSTKLSADQFAYMKNFILNPFLEAIFPIDIKPAVFSTYSGQNYNYRQPANVSNIITFVTNENQGISPYSFIALPLKYFVDQNVVSLATADLAVNSIIFAGGSLALTDVPAVKNYTSILTANGNTLTVVLVNPNVDQTYYRNVTGLNIVVWTNPATTVAEIESKMNCGSSSSTSTITTTTGTTTTSTSTQSSLTSETTTLSSTTSTESTTSITGSTSSISTSTSTESTTLPSITSTTTVTSTSTTTTPPTSTSTITSTVVTSPSTSETTTVSTTSTTTTPPIPVCKSYISFSFDVATDLTAAQFADLKTFLVSPFLEQLFPLDVQPAWYSTYDTRNHGYDRSNNVSEVINNVQNSVQSVANTSDFTQPLDYFSQQVGAFGSAFNTIIFAGSPLTDVDTANFLAPSLTTNGNTLTVVLVNPSIDQSNYRQVDGLKIVVWSNPATTIAAIRAVMNCSGSSISTVTTTMHTTTAPTSTQPSSTTTLTTTTVVPSTTTTVTSTSTETTTTSSTTIPSSTSTTTVTSTSTTTTPPTSTSTITSTAVTSPSTSETTTVGTTSTTTTPISVCHSLIPFSFDVATDLTATQFADLKTFLVNPFLNELFPLDVQPAWYSTYDTTNHGYDRPNNVSDIATTVQSLSQSTATTSDFIVPLNYFVNQGVVALGSSTGMAVNTIIFAGSPLTDVDSATFLAPTFTSNGNKLTVVLVNPTIDQTNYRQVPELNIVVWSDPATTLVAIKNAMNCQPLSTTSVVTSTTTVTTTPNPTTTTQTTTAAPTTTTSTMMTTTYTYPRAIDIAVILDGSLCSSGIGNLNSQLTVLEKIFHEYTFGLNVRVAFANPINMDVEYTFVCDMASINATIQTINQYCEFAILDDQQRLNDSIIKSMNALYNLHSPALAFLLLLQSNGTVYTNETDSVVAATIAFRQNCLEPTNAKVVVVQVDNFYPVDPALASDGFFFNNTADIGTRVAEAFVTIRNYNATAYTCASGQNFAPDSTDPTLSTCYPNS